MNGIFEKINMIWSANSEGIFKKAEESVEYEKQMDLLKVKEAILMNQLTPSQSIVVREYMEAKLLADIIAAESIYREGFVEGIKTIVQIMEVCKSNEQLQNLIAN